MFPRRIGRYCRRNGSNSAGGPESTYAPRDWPLTFVGGGWQGRRAHIGSLTLAYRW